jgi:O-succinylbenzoic acid--CoA ligase
VVERTVRELEGFAQAVVVAADDSEWGQVPIVVVEGTPPAVTLAEVREFVTERRGRAAAPARVLPVTRLPLLSSGKPDRVAVARLAAGTAEDIESAPTGIA